ncbi:ABC transporter ATP-binding protein [Isobaculum melis]|uniref:ATP-binding cassette, subfamily B n=1 Tax=Isobaculum melis TaxID=142588 RepID=A0A1H9PSQ6_9LACT|nr:ABC transporter ATP-binding protein [Isobaculum melis]SER50845.1 ATP-binding cassette, subfamily B [Isobaculum melis]
MENLKKLISYTGNYRKFLYGSIFLSALSTLLLFIPYYSVYRLISFSLLRGKEYDVTFYGLIALSSIILGLLMYYLSLWCSHLAGFRIERNMRNTGMNRLLNVSLNFFDTNESGKVRKTIDDNAAITHSFVAHNLPDLVNTVISPILILSVMFYLSWQLALLLIVVMVLSLLCIKRMMGNVETMQKYLTSLERMTTEATEFVRGMQVIKIFNASLDTFKNFRQSINDYSDWALKYSFSVRQPFIANQIVLNALGVILVLVAYPFLQQSPLDTLFFVNLIFCMIFSSKLVSFLLKILYTGKNASMAFEAVNRLDGLFEAYEMTEPVTQASSEFHTYDIAFKDVAFSYIEGLPVLKKLSFVVPEGSLMAIVGGSGSGKSTIAKLASKMYEGYDGRIEIGGVPLNKIDEEFLMDNMSYIFQETKLFNKSILDNLKMANPMATKERIQKALKDSECLEIIDKLPLGLDTKIGSTGVYLSGGEQQRLAICRVFLKDDPIIILDEVSASIDPENEYKIQLALDRLIQHKTVIMIAHKLSLIENADQIIVLKEGEIVEKGTHHSLLEKHGIYEKMQALYVQTKHWNLEEGKNNA